MAADSLERELIELEKQGWQALCTPGGADYYREHLADDALMAFPFGVLDRQQSLDAMETARPWARFEMTEPRVIELGPDSGVVVYGVTAQRAGDEPFTAVISSTFVRRDGDWKLAFHQQSF
jgi:hypothetical protein